MSTLPLLPDSDRPKLIGIARLAAEGESIREGHNIEYFTLPTRSILNRVVSNRNLPFTWAINPYQPAERRYEITRALLEEFARHRGFEIGIVTKSNLVVRDTELLLEISRNNRLFVNLTVTTINTDLARILEPRAPRPDLRLEAVHQLNLAGVAAGVICAPVLPGITDNPRDLEALVEAAAKAGAKYLFANALFLKPCSAAVFLPFLEKQFPQLVESYRERYEQRAFLPPAFGKRLSQLMACLRDKYGITNAYERYARRAHPVPSPDGDQLALFPAQKTA